MIKFVQIRKDNECLLSTKSVNEALNFVDGLVTCQHVLLNTKKANVDLTSCFIDFLVDYVIPCGDHFSLQFSVKLNFNMSNYDLNRFLIDFVKPYLN